jgi:hypothetical protein
LIEIKNYPPVSLFHDFGEGVTGNSKLWQFLPPFKITPTVLRKPWNGETTGAYLFHRALKQPATSAQPPASQAVLLAVGIMSRSTAVLTAGA